MGISYWEKKVSINRNHMQCNVLQCTSAVAVVPSPCVTGAGRSAARLDYPASILIRRRTTMDAQRVGIPTASAVSLGGCSTMLFLSKNDGRKEEK